MYLSALPAVAEPSSCSDGTYSPTLPSIPTGTAEPSIRFCRAFFLPVPQPRPGSFHTHHCQTAEKMPREEPERTECAILRLPHPEAVRRAENALLTRREGRRKPPRPLSVRNIAKSGTTAFHGVFRPENDKHRTSLGESSEVLPQKYGGLCQRSPMFFNKNAAFLLFFADFFRVFAAKNAAHRRKNNFNKYTF